MTFLARFLLGTGALRPKLRSALEAEGLVLIEEGLHGSIRYEHFKAPGRRFHGKVTVERMGLGMSEERLALYCRSGRVKLVDTAYSDPRFSKLDISVEDGDTVAIRIDYDRLDVPRVSGQMTLRATTPTAARIVSELHARVGRGVAHAREGES